MYLVLEVKAIPYVNYNLYDVLTHLKLVKLQQIDRKPKMFPIRP